MQDLIDKTISVLGSTGSVGTQTLDVARRHGVRVHGLTGCRNVALIETQIREFSPEVCAMADPDVAADLKVRVADTGCRVIPGSEAVCEVASSCENDVVVNAVTGVAGLLPSVAALEAGNDLALANKETIVTAGEYVTGLAQKNSCRILPVDSEHSAIFQCINADAKNKISRIVITASGGPFLGKKREELLSVTPEQALCHPVWNMGKKISVDSATLMNKGFEVIEAARLFGVCADCIDVVVHPEGIIHSMVEYIDRATLAQMSYPDMRLCIQYALTYPERIASGLAPLSLADVGTLTFFAPDVDTFRLLPLAYDVLRSGGTTGATLNAANERAVDLFLEGSISFTDIFDYVCEAVAAAPNLPLTVDNVFEADSDARRCVDKLSGR